MERAYVYGDSLLKATVPDETMRYHFHLAEVMAQYPTERLEVVNRATFFMPQGGQADGKGY